jgi:hypothetical protein
MEFLYKLTLNGNISEAGKWSIPAVLFGRKRDNPMKELGFKVARQVLKREKSPARAATILVFVGLHTAYNSVLAASSPRTVPKKSTDIFQFTSVLDSFMKEMYNHANAGSTLPGTPKWLEVQELAFRDDKYSFVKLNHLVQDTERTSVRLPLIRTAKKDRDFGTWSVKQGDTIILDIVRTVSASKPSKFTNIFKYRAYCDALEAASTSDEPLPPSVDLMNHRSSIPAQFADYDPKHVAAMSVTAMIKIIAQMRNPRRGHDVQGRLKKVNIDSTAEGYSNFMAPMRMARISQQVKRIQDHNTAHEIFTGDILRPATDTYLTPEWDEFIPFPNTWKIRFDGFGRSDYSKDSEAYGALRQARINPDALAAPPFYQPKGMSAIGGAFADIGCKCNVPGGECPCKGRTQDKQAGGGKGGASDAAKVQTPADREVTISTGCGVGK